MASRSTRSFAERSKQHSHPLARGLFDIAERKKTNIVLSADLTTTAELLDITNGKYVSVVLDLRRPLSYLGRWTRLWHIRVSNNI